jgi:proline iminopeptidase
MDADPGPTPDRLTRAERLVTAAVDAGAQLAVLPELFNTGYAYSDENHARVETLDGPTATWMRDIAARLDVHLAGSLMLLERGQVYNALLLYAPDGRMWRYDKNYPWGWERGYFSRSRQDPKVTVAETDLGDIGLLICWDAAHPELWALYAGRVDLMVICSCPPNVGEATYQFPNDDHVTFEDLGPRAASIKGVARRLFGEMIDQQTAWLGVPAVNTVGCGHIRTHVPRGRHTLLGYTLAAPRLLKYLPQANRLQMSCDMVHECKVVDGRGHVLARLNKGDGEAFALAQVRLPGAKTAPQEPQPASRVSRPVYLLSDVYLPAIVRPIYRKGQRQWRTVREGDRSTPSTAAEYAARKVKHRRLRYIRNYEEEEYGRDHPFVEPDSVVDGLAVYTAGRGEPLLLFPYPHGHTTEPVVQGPIAKSLAGMGRTTVTFDVPGAYRSTREPVGDVDEMIRSADETLDRLGIQGPVDVVGHSMGGFTALAYAIERPERVRRLVLVTSLSGFPAAARWGLPGSAFRIYQPDYWRIIVWGIWLNAGRGNLALHKRLQNLMERASYHDAAAFTPVEIDADDHEKGVPIRTIWSRNVYARLSYARRLGEVRASTLVLAGRHDPEAPLPCSEELVRGIPDARLFVFERSGHFPFLEEAPLFVQTVDAFLNGRDGSG